MPRKHRDHKAEYQQRKKLAAERAKAEGREFQGRKTGKKTGRRVVSPINGAVMIAGAHPGNTGGKPGRSGRRPNWIRELAGALLDEHELLEIAVDLAKGQVEISEDRNTGEPIFLSSSAGERLSAIRFITERAAGRPPQPIEGDEDEPPVRVDELQAAREKFHGRMARLTSAS